MYPPRCPVCDNILYEKNSIKRPDVCNGCLKDIRIINQPACMKCGKQLEDEIEEFCHDCKVKSFEYERGVAAFSYSKAMKRSMYAFKYNNRREYAEFYSKVICEKYNKVIRSWDVDVLMPVPLHRRRFIKRGYNQAQVVADAISKKLGIAVDAKTLVRSKNTKPQKELTDKERNNNIENAFQISPNGIKYNKVILVDDIYTTGTTINECARVLKRNGVKSVYFVSVCVGNGF